MTLLEINIVAGGDDGHIDGTNFFNSGGGVWMGSSSGDQHVFLLFKNVTIDKDSLIDDAKVTLELASETATSDITARWAAEDADDPLVFDSYSGGSDPWTGRTSTTATVDWTLDAGWATGSKDTPDLATIIQEIVNRPGWVSGNDILLWMESISPNGGEEWEFEAFEGTLPEAKLTINFTTDQDMTPGLAQQLVTSFAPTLTSTIDMTPGLAQQLVSSFAPAITLGDASVTPDLAQQLVTTFTPLVVSGFSIGPVDPIQQLVTAFDPVVVNLLSIITPDLISQLVVAYDTGIFRIGDSPSLFLPSVITNFVEPDTFMDGEQETFVVGENVQIIDDAASETFVEKANSDTTIRRR